MAKYLLIGLHNAVAGREDEFNRWYDNQHLHDCLATPGFLRAQRFELDDTQIIPGSTSPWHYMVIYELETDDPNATLNALVERGRSGQLIPSDALDPNGIFIVLAKPITPEVTPRQVSSD
jgi:hypothetical protein